MKFLNKDKVNNKPDGIIKNVVFMFIDYPFNEKVEKLSAKLHEIYMIEAMRQEKELGKPVRHHMEYEQLEESTKEYDRVLARFILDREASLHQDLLKVREIVERLTGYPNIKGKGWTHAAKRRLASEALTLLNRMVGK